MSTWWEAGGTRGNHSHSAQGEVHSDAAALAPTALGLQEDPELS